MASKPSKLLSAHFPSARPDMGVGIQTQILVHMQEVLFHSELYLKTLLFLQTGSLMWPNLTKNNLEFLVTLPLPLLCWGLQMCATMSNRHCFYLMVLNTVVF